MVRSGRLAFLSSGLSILLLLLTGVPADAAQSAARGDETAAQVDETASTEGASSVTQADNSSPSQGALSDSDWFDSDQGRLIPVEVTTEEDDTGNRDSRWLPQAKRVRARSTTTGGAATGGGTGGGTGFFGSGLTLGNVLGWLLLVVTVGLAAFLIAYALSKSEFEFTSGSAARASRRAAGPDEQTLERMKHLPAELRRTDVNFRTEAERLMQQGSFDQAIILLFAHQLLLLDRAGMLRLNRGKTNRRYIRETRAIDRETADRLQRTIHSFERSYFGRHAISAAEFRRLWSENELLEQAVKRRQEVAA